MRVLEAVCSTLTVGLTSLTVDFGDTGERMRFKLAQLETPQRMSHSLCVCFTQYVLPPEQYHTVIETLGTKPVGCFRLCQVAAQQIFGLYRIGKSLAIANGLLGEGWAGYCWGDNIDAYAVFGRLGGHGFCHVVDFP